MSSPPPETQDSTAPENGHRKNLAPAARRFPTYAQWCLDWEEEKMATKDEEMKEKIAIDMKALMAANIDDGDEDIDMDEANNIERLLNNRNASLSPSETPDIKKWFSGYVCESLHVDTGDECDCGQKRSNRSPK